METIEALSKFIQLLDELGSRGGYVGGVAALLAIIIFNEYRKRSRIDDKVTERETVSHENLLQTVVIISKQHMSAHEMLKQRDKDLEEIRAKLESYSNDLSVTRTKLETVGSHLRAIVAYANRLRFQVDRQAELIRKRIVPLDDEAAAILFHKDGVAFWPEGLPEEFMNEHQDKQDK